MSAAIRTITTTTTTVSPAPMHTRAVTQADWLQSEKEQASKWYLSFPARADPNIATADDGPGWVMLICDTLQQPVMVDSGRNHRYQIAWTQAHPGAYLMRARDYNPSTSVLLIQRSAACRTATVHLCQQFNVQQPDGWFHRDGSMCRETLAMVRAILAAHASVTEPEVDKPYLVLTHAVRTGIAEHLDLDAEAEEKKDEED